MSTTAPPGWYPDPRDPRTEFWWDGTAYGASRPAPLPPAVVQSAAVQPGAAQPYAPAPVGYAPVAPQGFVLRPTHDALGRPISTKSRTVASLLAFFLGSFGVGRFYLGNVGMGVALLLTGWLTLGIWPLIDFIVIVAGSAHDGDGLPVVNWS